MEIVARTQSLQRPSFKNKIQYDTIPRFDP